MKTGIIFGITIICFGLNLACCKLSYAKDVSENELRQIEKEAEQKTLEFKKLQAQAIRLNLELTKINKDAINLAQEIQKNEASISKLEVDLWRLKEDVDAMEKAFKGENNSLILTIASLQNMSLNPSESVILQPHSPVDLIRSAILLRETVPFINEKTSKLKVDLDALYSKKKKLELVMEQTTKSQDKLKKQQKTMKIVLKKKSDLRKNIEDKGIEAQKTAELLASKAKDLRDLLEELERQKEIERQKREEQERLANLKRQQKYQKQQKNVKMVDMATHKTIKEQIKGGRFQKAKGMLTKPCAGSIITEYGQVISKGVTSKGIVYKTRSLAQVVAPYDGTVIFSGPFKGYGNIIIVEHGDGYLSLLGGLGQIDCEVGQMLLAGEPVGTMPENKETKLYVEIRKDRHPINPKPWIAG
ncbi:MAG: peptidoglycan DD-metalloendopeptidase family protein [Alphaproteobacteria bacterium]|nr:peptidoglycan DD-metalloendopeptidase family protein [Alphaproteobacteria bacterium]